jgi:prepilin-type N-terminal cleavage/methylation domain-containing protein
MRQQGFTLLELGAVLAITLILVMIGIPNYGYWVAEKRAAATLLQLKQALRFAQLQALRTGTVIILCKTDDGQHCGDSYQSQYLVATQATPTSQPHVHRVFTPVNAKINLVWKKFPDGTINQPIYFYPTMNFNQNGRFVVCDARLSEQTIRGIVRSTHGQLRDVVLNTAQLPAEDQHEFIALYQTCLQDLSQKFDS